MVAPAEEASLRGAVLLDSDDLEGSKSASKKQKVEEKNVVDKSDESIRDRKGDGIDSDDSSDVSGCEYEIYENDSDYETEEIKRKFYIYNKQITKSGGFDVDPEIIPGVAHFGGVRPVNLKNKDDLNNIWVRECVASEIKEHNETKEANLELVEVKKANVGPASGCKYYITLEARDSMDPEKLVRTYQCEAIYGVRGPDDEFGIHINFLRPKPEEKVR